MDPSQPIEQREFRAYQGMILSLEVDYIVISAKLIWYIPIILHRYSANAKEGTSCIARAYSLANAIDDEDVDKMKEGD